MIFSDLIRAHLIAGLEYSTNITPAVRGQGKDCTVDSR